MFAEFLCAEFKPQSGLTRLGLFPELRAKRATNKPARMVRVRASSSAARKVRHLQ